MYNRDETKYEMVVSYLLNYIAEHQLKAGDKLPTEMYLVNELGLSRITVQRALRELQQQGIVNRMQGKGTYVSERAKRVEADKEIQFIPFVLTNDNAYTGALDYIQGADAYLSSHSYYLTVHASHRNSEEECKVIRRLVEDGARCIIVQPFTSSENYPFYFQMMQTGVDFVFVDRKPQNLVANFVMCDNITGGYQAARHLIGCGAKRIGFISNEPRTTAQSLEQRLTGYQMALGEAGFPFEERYVRFSGENQDVKGLVQELLDLPEPPDALFCVNDITAVEALNYLQSVNVRVPDDMKIIGFDNLTITQNAAVPISTIEQPFFQIGYEAARIARKLVIGERDYVAQEILPVQLLERMSTGKKDSSLSGG